MREGISNIWLIGIIILFISIFASYIAITINYTSSFKIKNEVLTIIEKHKGMTSNDAFQEKDSIVGKGKMYLNAGALQTINLYLMGRAYTSTGYCPKNDGNTWYGVENLYTKDELKGKKLAKQADNNTKYYYCFARFENKTTSGKNTAYYKVRLFYKTEFPALSEFLSIKVEGITDEIYDPQDAKENYKNSKNVID